jgi:hypothetical protein
MVYLYLRHGGNAVCYGHRKSVYIRDGSMKLQLKPQTMQLKDCKSLDEVLAWLESLDHYDAVNIGDALDRMRDIALEEAAQLCLSKVEAFQYNGTGWHLTDRDEGSLNGTAYAAAIRALKNNHESKSND